MRPRPAFLVTIDTEADDLWARPRQLTTRNTAALPRFQALCERYGIRPTYLATYEVAVDPVFRDFGLDLLRRGAGEIGMHLHAWTTPPIIPLTDDDLTAQPYLIEHDTEVMRLKIGGLTRLLEETFGRRPVSHRAGRWALDARYARLLVEFGYRVDATVTPHVSWQDHRGARGGGPDYRGFLSTPYFVDLEDIRRPGASPLLEVPVTVLPRARPRPAALERVFAGSRPGRRLLDRYLPAVWWLRPNGRNGGRLLEIVQRGVDHGVAHLTMVLHSSELAVGQSRVSRTHEALELLYRDLERLFAAASRSCWPATLAEFSAAWAGRTAPVGAGAVG